MATYTKFQQFVEDLAHGVHNFDSNTIKVACKIVTSAGRTDERTIWIKAINR